MKLLKSTNSEVQEAFATRFGRSINGFCAIEIPLEMTFEEKRVVFTAEDGRYFTIVPKKASKVIYSESFNGEYYVETVACLIETKNSRHYFYEGYISLVKADSMLTKLSIVLTERCGKHQ